jgi:superfamily II DNA or RNA helicase
MYEMAEGDDDNLYVEDDKPVAAPRVVSVKEIFKPVESSFKRVHSPMCTTCDMGINPNKGAFVFCQGCSYSYHKLCLGLRSQRDHRVTKVGEDSFVLQCRFCINVTKTKDHRAPDLSLCQTCHEPGKACHPFSQKKTPKQEELLRQQNGGVDPLQPIDQSLVNNEKIVLFRCSDCHRGFHLEHLPRPVHLSDIAQVTSDTIRTKTLKEFSVDWKCQECLDVSDKKPDSLVAWRPKDSTSYVGQSVTDYTEDELEYLVKWENQSHLHCTWQPGSWVHGTIHAGMRNAYLKRVVAEGIPPKYDMSDAIPEEYITIDVVLGIKYKPGFHHTNKATDLQNADKVHKVYAKFVGLAYDDSVWDEPPTPDSPRLYAAYLEAYEDYLSGVYFEDDSHRNMVGRARDYRKLDFARDLEKSTQPTALRNGELMKYQISGVNWLKYNFHKQHNAILADEMGLGKTVQIVAMIADLVLDKPRVWPFLVVVPNSTVPNWRREMKKWAPDLRVVTYHGGKVPQDLAYHHELFPRNSEAMKAHVVVMSYEAAQDSTTKHRFKSVQFAGLVVDEGHRLKNEDSLLYAALVAMKIPFKVLLTGTPLQNNKRELFNLLQFLDPKVDAAKLDEEYSELTVDNIPTLHDLIRPFFLRRTKADTLLFLPKMARVIVPVTMTVLQKEFSQRIMAKNSALLQSLMAKDAVKKTDRASLNNILMQLRKVLCHPFVYSSQVEDKTVDPVTMHNNMVEASAKLLLLNIMLPKLKERGHRVLLFSQFLDQIDILEDFLSGIGLTYSRIDGSISSLEKQKRIDAFNAPDSPLFAMLLSTRAGGVGINLATADTVIVLDPDFNPHQDLQALSRSHRIGQKKPVLCFTITTKDSVEEKIMQAGRKKMALDHALIESIDNSEEETADLVDILKHGAEQLFGEGKRETIVYDSASVDKLLDRDRLIAEQNPPKAEGAEGDEGTKPRAAFGHARVWDNNTGHTDEVPNGDGVEQEPVINQSAWAEIIRLREEEARREAEANKEILGRGGRRRGKVSLHVVSMPFKSPTDPHYDAQAQYTGDTPGPDGLPNGAMQIDEISGYDTDFIGDGSEDDSEGESDKDAEMYSDDEKSRAKKPKAAKASQGKTLNKSPSKLSGKAVTPKKTATPKKATATPKKAVAVKKATPKTATPAKGKTAATGKITTPRKPATPSKAPGSKRATPLKATQPKKNAPKKTTPQKVAPTPNDKPTHVTPARRVAPAKKGKKATTDTDIDSDNPQIEKPTPSTSQPSEHPDQKRANPALASPKMAATETPSILENSSARNEEGPGSIPPYRPHGLPRKPPTPVSHQPVPPPGTLPNPPPFSGHPSTLRGSMQGLGYYPNVLMPGLEFTASPAQLDPMFPGPVSPMFMPYLPVHSQAPGTMDPRQIFQQSMVHQHQQQDPQDVAEAPPPYSPYLGFQTVPLPEPQDAYQGQPSSPTDRNRFNQWPQ